MIAHLFEQDKIKDDFFTLPRLVETIYLLCRFPCGVALWLCIRAGDCEKADLSPQQIHGGSTQG
jgi:hypothetical protein